MTPAAIVAGYLVLVACLWWPGNWFCRGILWLCGPVTRSANGEDEPAEGIRTTLKGGRVIGMLERIFVAIGIFAARWELIAAVIALKSVARYSELNKQDNAEYFLVGSLASILWAILVAFALLNYDRHAGFGLAWLVDQPG